jgi:hypothetical protein
MKLELLFLISLSVFLSFTEWFIGNWSITGCFALVKASRVEQGAAIYKLYEGLDFY